MITIDTDSCRISFIEKHLFDPEIVEFDGILERYKEYNVELFLHIVSDPSCRYEQGPGATRTLKDISELSAKERFISLLNNRELTANPKGFYANKFKEKEAFPDEIKSVSFAHCKQKDVAQHFDARKSEYGIVFYHDFLLSMGMIPVRYVNEEDEESIRRLVFNEPFALEAYGRRYDMRWENEWRINRDVCFDTENVAFVIVPDDEYEEFICLAIDEELDYFILPSSVFKSPFDFFLKANSLEHHCWQQMLLYGCWKVDFDMFPEFDEGEKGAFLDECSIHLECLAKAEVQYAYESRYISRFLNFASRLSEDFLKETSFKELVLVNKNAAEPFETHRDLMMHCYTKRYEIQKDRIEM
ncbi:TPA: hypothetical protein ACVOYM_003418 [Vibrio diabolicus]